MHPICHKYLIEECEKKGASELPAALDCTVVWKESIYLDERNMRRYKYLGHLPENQEIIFLQLDMTRLLSEDLLTEFSSAMEKHRQKLEEKESLESERLEELEARRALKK